MSLLREFIYIVVTIIMKRLSFENNHLWMVPIILIVFIIICSIIVVSRYFDEYHRSPSTQHENIPHLDTNHLDILGIYTFSDQQTLSLDGHECDCAICLERFVSGDLYRTMPYPCLHNFHKSCIDQWFNHSEHCPLCNRSIKDIIDSVRATEPSHGRERISNTHDPRGTYAMSANSA
jgi:hypothetical protein